MDSIQHMRGLNGVLLSIILDGRPKMENLLRFSSICTVRVFRGQISIDTA